MADRMEFNEDESGDWTALLGGEDMLEGSAQKDEVEAGSEAPALLAEVKERLEAGGQGGQYHDFLMAVSSAEVDAGAALSIIKGYPDLVASFRRCFRANAVQAPRAAAPQEEPHRPDRRGADARSQQLVQLVFAGKVGGTIERSQMLDYVRSRAAHPAFPRRLFIVRGVAALGKSTWAEQQLHREIPSIKDTSSFAARLAHVCSADDFSTQFVGSSHELKYIFNPRRAGANSLCNEARVRLAMEAGIEPLYVDNCNTKLWEMRPYVLLAERLGYVVTVIAPSQISESWNDIDFLMSRNNLRKKTDKFVTASSIEDMVEQFEALPADRDHVACIKGSRRAAAEQAVADQTPTSLPPSAILCKLDKLLIEGTSLLHYVPPDGKGWGVNGELGDEWHSFKECGDGSCTYQDAAQWDTEEAETGWSFIEMTMLEDLKKRAFELPKADLPSATSHPALFAQKNGQKGSKDMHSAAAVVKSEEDVPISRKERFALRQLSEMKTEHTANGDQTLRQALGAQRLSAAAVNLIVNALRPDLGDGEDDGTSRGPTEQEEMSAATFLAAVKMRLSEWGKLDQYHEFVMAISGSVDAKAAVRILRGHDDLLSIFRRKFAPAADLLAIKAEIAEEGDGPRPPSAPPPGRAPVAGFSAAMVKSEVKSEVDARGRQVAPSTVSGPKTAAQALPAKPAPGSAAHLAVKAEWGAASRMAVKAEGAARDPGDVPRPPTVPRHVPRGVVTVGDDSDEEMQNEASIVAAVRKGRDAVIGEMAKTLFYRERDSQGAARERLALVHYAAKVAAKPRFPRELFILRGAPGIDKTGYAMQSLIDLVGLENGEDSAARLTHVCAVDDFFETFASSGEREYKFKAHKLENYHSRNETRVRLAMEAGMHPLYVDAPNLRVWEMRPYVMLADTLGYVVTIVEPREITERWNDLEFLVAANDTPERREAGKVVERGMLAACLKAFEGQEEEDILPQVRLSKRPTTTRVIEPLLGVAEPSEAEKNAWMIDLTKDKKVAGNHPAAWQFTTPAQAFGNASAGKGKAGKGGSQSSQKRPASAALAGIEKYQKAPRLLLPAPPVRQGGFHWG